MCLKAYAVGSINVEKMLCPIRLHSGPLTKSKAVKGGRGLASPTQHFAFPPYSFLLSPCLSHLGPHIVSACLPKLHYMKSFHKDYLSFSLSSAITQLGDPRQVLATIRFSFISKVKSKTLSVHSTGFPGHSKDIIFQRSIHQWEIPYIASVAQQAFIKHLFAVGILLR